MARRYETPESDMINDSAFRIPRIKPCAGPAKVVYSCEARGRPPPFWSEALGRDEPHPHHARRHRRTWRLAAPLAGGRKGKHRQALLPLSGYFGGGKKTAIPTTTRSDTVMSAPKKRAATASSRTARPRAFPPSRSLRRRPPSTTSNVHSTNSRNGTSREPRSISVLSRIIFRTTAAPRTCRRTCLGISFGLSRPRAMTSNSFRCAICSRTRIRRTRRFLRSVGRNCWGERRPKRSSAPGKISSK